MIRLGMVWWYRKYADEQTPADQDRYEDAEVDARSRKVGLWADEEPVPLCEWGKRR